MALTNIVTKITGDAEQEAAAIYKKAEERKKQLQKEAEEKMETMKRDAEEQLVRQKKAMEHKVEAHAQMEGKMAEVTLKTELMATAQEKALQKIKALSEKDQLIILKKLLAAIGAEEGGVLHPAKGQKALIEKALQAIKKKTEVGSEADIPAGFLFVGDKIDIDANYATLLQKEIFPRVEAKLSVGMFT